MRLTILVVLLTVVTIAYLFWFRNAITRVPGYTTPIGQTPTVPITPRPRT